MKLIALLLTCAVMGTACGQREPRRTTLARVRATHELSCGVVREDAEYSTEEDHSSRGGFDEGLCDAIAVAVDTQTRVKLTSFLDEVSAVGALRAGRVDVIATLSADAQHRYEGTRLSRSVFYDALALLTPVAGGLQRPEDFAGKKICVLAETGNEEALRTWYTRHRVDYLPFPFQEEGEMEAAYVTHNCAALAAERTRLSLIRVSMGSGAEEHIILNEALSRDPMAIATRDGDRQWAAVVDNVAASLFLAEQLGLCSGKRYPDDVRTARFDALAVRAPSDARALGLRPTWAAEVVLSTGCYGDLYERTLGGKSDRGMPRDLNHLQQDGGDLVAPRDDNEHARPAKHSSP